MKNKYIADFKTGEDLTDFFMLKAVSVRTGSNKKNYLDMTLGDKTGEIAAKKWDLADEEMNTAKKYKEGSLIKIRGTVTEWNGKKQLKVLRIRMSDPHDELSLRDFIKTAPEPPEAMYEYILQAAEHIADADLRQLTVMNLREYKDKLMYYPAASKNHHAEMAGLLWHIKRMLMTGEKICQVYDFLDADLITCGVILHDIQKINEIRSNELGISDGYSVEGQLLGHIVMAVRDLGRQMEDLGFPKEKALLVEHMIIAHHYEPEFGSPKKPLFPEAEILHYLDIIDARMYDMEEALRGTQEGDFTERIWTLENRRLYKPHHKEGAHD